MMLAGRKVRGRSIKHPFGQIDVQIIPEERLSQLVQRLRDGDKSVIDEIALSHIRLVTNVASRYANFAPHKADDLVSEAARAIVEVVAHPKRLEDNNITPTIVAKAHSLCDLFLRKDRIAGAERRTLKKMSMAAPNCYQLEEGIVHRLCDCSDQRMLELWDMIKAVAKTEEERKIIELRAEGYTDLEIGRMFGRSKDYVNKIRIVLRNRFNALTAACL